MQLARATRQRNLVHDLAEFAFEYIPLSCETKEPELFTGVKYVHRQGGSEGERDILFLSWGRVGCMISFIVLQAYSNL